MFEVAYAAAAMLAAGDEAGCKGRLILSGSSITSPFLLPKAAGTSAGRAAADKLPALFCTVQQGRVGLSSAHGSVVHLQGELSALPQHARHSSAASTARSKADAASSTIMQGMTSIHDSTSEAVSLEAAIGSIDIQVRARMHACSHEHDSFVTSRIWTPMTAKWHYADDTEIVSLQGMWPTCSKYLIQQVKLACLCWHASRHRNVCRESSAKLFILLQDIVQEDYHCPPAVTDASTHFGAMTDIESGESARVPVGLGAYLPSKPSEVYPAPQLTSRDHMLANIHRRQDRALPLRAAAGVVTWCYSL